MGMYTELIFGAELKKDTPKEVIDIIQYMVGGDFEEDKELKIPEHNFFKTSRWRMLFTCSSYYFGVNESLKKMWYDEISNTWRISTRSNIKNYDSEIEEFLEWIKPYIEDGSGDRGFYAIVCYEEQEEPRIYYLSEDSQ